MSSPSPASIAWVAWGAERPLSRASSASTSEEALSASSSREMSSPALSWEASSSAPEAMFRTALEGLLSAVRAHGTHHDPATLDESDLILPPWDATLDEVRELLEGSTDGLIPG